MLLHSPDEFLTSWRGQRGVCSGLALGREGVGGGGCSFGSNIYSAKWLRTQHMVSVHWYVGSVVLVSTGKQRCSGVRLDGQQTPENRLFRPRRRRMPGTSKLFIPLGLVPVTNRPHPRNKIEKGGGGVLQSIVCALQFQGQGHSEGPKLVERFFLFRTVSSELFNVLFPNLLWWCIIMSQSFLQKIVLISSMTISYNQLSATVKAHASKILSYLLYLLSCWSFCHQT